MNYERPRQSAGCATRATREGKGGRRKKRKGRKEEKEEHGEGRGTWFLTRFRDSFLLLRQFSLRPVAYVR